MEFLPVVLVFDRNKGHRVTNLPFGREQCWVFVGVQCPVRQ